MVKHDIMLNEELNLSSEMLSFIYGMNPDAIVITRLSDSKIINCNQEYLNQVGYSKEEVIGHTAIDLNLIDPEIRKKYIRKIQDENGVSNFELKIKHKNGSYINVLYSARCVTINEERFLLNIGKDINNLKEYEEKLKLQSEIIEHIPEGVVLIRVEDNKIVYTNPKLNEMFGYKNNELNNKNVSILNAPSSNKDPEQIAEEITKS
jgi:PAS domain S-box-containing protein